MKMGVSADTPEFDRVIAGNCEMRRINRCHEHGMDRDLPFDDVPSALLQTPLINSSKGDP
jgi:hypothetical protein